MIRDANNPNAWGGHDEGYPPLIAGLNDAEMADNYYKEAFQWIWNNPRDFGLLFIPKYRRLFSALSVVSQRQDYPLPGANVMYGCYTLCLLASFAGALKTLRQWRQVGFLFAPVAGIIIFTGLFYGDARYTLPMVPSLVAFTALLVDSVDVTFKRGLN